MKNIVKILSISLLITSLLSACGKEEESADLTKPTAVITLDRDNHFFSPMSSIVINGSFSDNKELKECQVTISSLKSSRGFDLDWEPETYKIPLSGTEMTITGQQIFTIIPVDIKYGEYQITFKVLDTSDNYNFYTQDIVIQ
ncbi:DUF4625 domain-containing protein [Carboxylicivirga linearis]|uniref:DUF4625 domain-containing protein n=1 Tax=Carboxylicivirga linearis TaxID=1628157 RepID=A0ABS5JZV1_9BACT|nr:DUF4625 domain-containing protein [Carboxylicivirga linearis]MBS2100393.1 DUF4625 domain-containing protein [Carboxylicivirga linearis]